MPNLKRNSWIVINATAISSLFLIKYLNQNVGYANAQNCDPWYFFGVYQDYFYLRSVVGDAMQFNRFPAILPWIFLGPRISAVALTEAKLWTYFIISSGCFSYAALSLLGAFGGSLVSILFLASTLLIGALSTDFVTGAGIAWECALIAATIRAANSERPALWLIGVGALCACCIYTHIPMALFVFSIPLYLFLRPSNLAIANVTESVLWIIGGFLGVTIALCLTSLLLDGNFIFFQTELLKALNYFADESFHERPIKNVRDWFSYDSNIPLFIVAAAASLLTLSRLGLRRAITEFPALSIPALAYLATAIVCFGFEFGDRMVLQRNVFAPWMLPAAFLAIGSALSLSGLPNRTLSICLCATAAFVLVWAAARMDPEIDYWWRYILVVGALISLAVPFGAWSTAAATGCILALLAISYPTGYGSLPWEQMSLREPAFYELVRRAHRFVSLRAGAKSPTFWIAAKFSDFDDPRLVAIAAPRSFLECGYFPASYPSPQTGPEIGDQSFPDLQAAVSDHYISADHPLFIIAPGHDLVAGAAGAFQSVGLIAVPVAEMEIASGISIGVADVK